MTTTTIEWARGDDGAAGLTWNPVTGCDRVSPGCDRCYAASMARRLKAMKSPRYQRDGDPRTSGPGFAVTLHSDVLTVPLRWRKPRRVFVNSMSDLFHKDVPDAYLAEVFAVMAVTGQHTYQILTKRPARARALLSSPGFQQQVRDRQTAGVWPRHGGTDVWPLPNVWLGVSAESQQWADTRLPKLLDTPAAIRFVSCEPLLEAVDLTPYVRSVTGLPWHASGQALDWVIAGGESGPGARPIDPQWIRDLRDQSTAGGTAFFFKQWGEWAPAGYGIGYFRDPERLIGARLDESGHRQIIRRVGKKAAGRVLDDCTWDQFPTAERAHDAPVS
jgi:protein gp37